MATRQSLDPMTLPCCPYCDNAIEAHDEATVVEQDGVKFLAHADCGFEDDEEETTDAA
jgi:hypothetical protein